MTDEDEAAFAAFKAGSEEGITRIIDHLPPNDQKLFTDILEVVLERGPEINPHQAILVLSMLVGTLAGMIGPKHAKTMRGPDKGKRAAFQIMASSIALAMCDQATNEDPDETPSTVVH